jgi:hypothetical protein
MAHVKEICILAVLDVKVLPPSRVTEVKFAGGAYFMLDEI